MFANLANGDIPGCHDFAFSDRVHQSYMHTSKKVAEGFFIKVNRDADWIVIFFVAVVLGVMTGKLQAAFINMLKGIIR